MFEFYQDYYVSDGRATRMDFLVAYCVISITGAALGFASKLLIGQILGINLFDPSNIGLIGVHGFTLGDVSLTFLILISYLIINIFVVVWPLIATSIRRLHDINLSGWNFLWLIGAPMIAGFLIGAYGRFFNVPDVQIEKIERIAYFGFCALVTYVFVLKRGTKGTNRFGGDVAEIKNYIKQRKFEKKMGQ